MAGKKTTAGPSTSLRMTIFVFGWKRTGNASATATAGSFGYAQDRLFDFAQDDNFCFLVVDVGTALLTYWNRSKALQK
jgi:hypothetical protein